MRALAVCLDPLRLPARHQRSADGACPGRPRRGGPPRRRDHRRQAVHVVHLSDDAEEAVAVSAADGEGHARHARLSARDAAERARRSSPPRRAVAESRQRERAGLLEQLRRDSGRAGAEDGHDLPPPRRRSEGRRRSRGAGRRSRLGDAGRQDASPRADALRLPRHRRFTHHRSHDDPDGARRPGGVSRQQGRLPRHPRGARARAARRKPRCLHGRVRQARAARREQRRRQRPLRQQRGAEG